MTIPQLTRLAGKHGYELTCPDGKPVLRPVRDGAVLPGRVKWQFQQHRQAVVEWFRRTNRTGDEKCRRCLAWVTEGFDGEAAGMVCEEKRCPYKDA